MNRGKRKVPSLESDQIWLGLGWVTFSRALKSRVGTPKRREGSSSRQKVQHGHLQRSLSTDSTFFFRERVYSGMASFGRLGKNCGT